MSVTGLDFNLTVPPEGERESSRILLQEAVGG
jgi:hypothetical protein